MPFKSHTFSCAVCRRPTALDPRLGPELIAQLLRDEFAVLGLAKVAPLEPAYPGLVEFHHPLVCSDGCHARANREGIAGYSVLDGNEARFDADTFAPGYADDERNEP